MKEEIPTDRRHWPTTTVHDGDLVRMTCACHAPIGVMPEQKKILDVYTVNHKKVAEHL